MVNDMLIFIDIARQIMGIGALLLGSLAILIGALGLLRLGDVYQRMHGAGIIDTGGAGLVLLGLLLLSPDWTVAVRIALIGGLLIMTSPTATHAIARAARFSGVEPILSTDSKEKEG
jgi:multicomponent Na+:H+ antiporter subunit G